MRNKDGEESGAILGFTINAPKSSKQRVSHADRHSIKESESIFLYPSVLQLSSKLINSGLMLLTGMEKDLETNAFATYFKDTTWTILL